MFTISKDFNFFSVLSEESIATALKKMTHNECGVIFSIDETGEIEGVLTDGDVRRWMVKHDNFSLDKEVKEISKKNFRFAYIHDSDENISIKFAPEKNIKVIPLLNNQNRLVAVAKLRSNNLKINNFVISKDSPAFIIAEIGNNHNGDMDIAKKLIDISVDAGVNCVKFQMRTMDSLYIGGGDSNNPSEDLGSQYVLDLLSKHQLSDENLFRLFDYCYEQKVVPLCTPWDSKSFYKLESYGIEAFKIASADVTNHDLIKTVMSAKKPLICSTGMSLESEIIELVGVLKEGYADYALLHCNSTYPAPFKDINLSYLNKLEEIGKCIVGYSGHERGVSVAIAAVAMGAKIVEKHITLDRDMEGNDHKASLMPYELKEMVLSIRNIEDAIGCATKSITQGEVINRETLGKSVVAKREILKGEVLLEDMLDIKSPGKGLSPNKKKFIIGKVSKRDMKQGDFFYDTDLRGVENKPKNYSFKHKWGIPVRYHDFKDMLKISNPDLLEFHLSYKDLEINFEKYFESFSAKKYNLIIHAPELFSGDHILDLCSLDEDYRKHSILELQRVIDTTRKLQTYFNQDNTPIVTNVGGYSREGFVSQAKKSILYNKLSESISELDSDGVLIIPQTMPPFPWHFGGQSHHNLFVDPLEIANFCEHNKMQICLDISHSQLACNHLGLEMSYFMEQIGQYVRHMHIADASGIDGEGLQIGDGSIDFRNLLTMVEDNTSEDVTFIPEIWQGHKNRGEGFWTALNKLEKIGF